MSSWGRCQNALWDIYSYEDGQGRMHYGPIGAAGITSEQWSKVTEAIIETIYPIAHQAGVESAEHSRKATTGD